jgi:AICAR transformylase/IMP cyclohydrolase PurH
MAVYKIPLRYGCNPHQVPAQVFFEGEKMPLTVLNGSPGYINLLDALNAWQLVKELKECLGLPAAASFKHVSPAGAAVAQPLSSVLKKVYLAENLELSPLATAYLRARGADRMSSFGDWAAVSDTVDLSTAQVLKREVSDGIIAPDYQKEALEVLKRKKEGTYRILKIDPTYSPPQMERREVFGLVLEQARNNYRITPQILQNPVTQNKSLPSFVRRDLLVATITLKYTQSNSVCLAFDGQVIGLGAGQQSRIHCTRLACQKAEHWFLLQHPKLISLKFKAKIGLPERINIINQHLAGEISLRQQREIFEEEPVDLSEEEKKSWLEKMKDISLSSDAFFPFPDSLIRAHRSGVKYVLQPGNSLRDEEIIKTADRFQMVMIFSGVRLFHH